MAETDSSNWVRLNYQRTTSSHPDSFGHFTKMTDVMISPPLTLSTSSHFVGRQPILDRHLNLYGHELFFRPGTLNEFSGDPEQATKSVIDNSLFLMPHDDSQTTFINCTRDTLVSGIVTLLPQKNTVLEILENVEADPEVLECCRALKSSGYRFAMDDFTEDELTLPFIEIAEFIKIDFLVSDVQTRHRIYSIAARANLTVIAEKVETEEDVEQAWAEGCSLFQGYFFCKPIMTRPKNVPQNQLVYMRLLAELMREPANLRVIESLTMSEPSICYRLLRLVNSALYGLPAPVESVRGAVMMIGDDEFRKLVTIALANLAASSKSKAAIRVSLERAKFCESLAPGLRESGSALYLLGMLSLMDVVLSMPMQQVMDHLPIHQRIKAALLGERNALSIALDLVRAREHGGWIETSSIQDQIGLSGAIASRLYSSAVQWADTVCSLV